MTATRSTIWQKAGATAINAGLAGLLAAPALWWGLDVWRPAWLGAFLAYNLALRDQCVGCWVMHIWQTRRCPMGYSVLYTVGLASCAYWVVVPGDLLLVNGMIQVTFLNRTGNTAHGWLAGVATQRYEEMTADD